MGAESTNVILAQDRSTGECYVEFHRRIVVPRRTLKTLEQLLDEKRYADAKTLLDDVAPTNARRTIELLFADLESITGHQRDR